MNKYRVDRLIKAKQFSFSRKKARNARGSLFFSRALYLRQRQKKAHTKKSFAGTNNNPCCISLSLSLLPTSSLRRPLQHRDTQETLTVLDRLDLDTEKPTEEELARKFGFEEAYYEGTLTWWQKLKPQMWSLFDEPYSSVAAKVGFKWIITSILCDEKKNR